MPLKVTTRNGGSDTLRQVTYDIHYCPGKDFFVCDQLNSWQAIATNLVGNGSLTPLSVNVNYTFLALGDITMRLKVKTKLLATGRVQELYDYMPVHNLGP